MQSILISSLMSALFFFTSSAQADTPATVDTKQADEKRMERIKQATYQLDRAMAERVDLRERFAQVRDQVRSQTGLLEITPDAIRQVIGRLQEQREQLELDGAGAAGRRQGLDDAIAELSAKLKERSQNDAVVEQLAAVVVAREQQLKKVQMLAGQNAVAQSEVDAAQANLASAKAELAVARQQAAKRPSTDVLDAWNRQRLELSISELERQARLSFIEKRLKSFGNALSQFDKLEDLRTQLAQADRAVARGQDQLDAARQPSELHELFRWIQSAPAEGAQKR